MHLELLAKELDRKSEEFSSFADIQTDESRIFLEHLESIRKDQNAKSALSVAPAPGCVPSAEYWDSHSLEIEFKENWSNHSEAREWAGKALSERTVFAADGSQAYFQKETTLPLGVVQIGWFENPHSSERDYEKGAEVELLTPKDLLENQEEPLNPETRIGEKRFRLEVRRVKQFIESKRGWEENGEKMPVAFFDGTLLVSFSLPVSGLQDSFHDELIELIDLSEECRIPVIGYVARSFAKDLVALVRFFHPDADETTVYDSAILNSSDDILSSWGDRTVFFHSKRKGLEKFSDVDTNQPKVGFVYMKAGSGEIARLDIPNWVYQKELLSETIDIVRAECVIGLGYPYCLETADATALISVNARNRFLAMLKEFSERENLGFSVSRKQQSKARRR